MRNAKGLALVRGAVLALVLVGVLGFSDRAGAICGDVDGNGIVTGDDAGVAARAVVAVALLTPEQLLRADVAAAGKEPDGRVMSNDIALIDQAARGRVHLSCGERTAGSVTTFKAVDVSLIKTDGATGRKYAASQLLLRKADGVSYSAAVGLIEASGGTVAGYNPALGIFQVELAAGTDEGAAAAAFGGMAQFDGASLHWIFTAGSYTPNDPPYIAGAPGEQRRAFDEAHAADAWGLAAPGAAPVIANIDTGIDGTNIDFSGRLVTGADFVDANGSGTAGGGVGGNANWHGTFVAGIEAAAGDNASGIAGVCWNCRVMPVRACGDDGLCPFFAVMNAVAFAADGGAEVINISLESPAAAGSSEWKIFQSVINYAASKGAFIVAAAGNGRVDAAGVLPAGLDNVFAVAASDESGNPAEFSNFGAAVDLYAPGKDVYSLLPGGAAGLKSGTSMSAAFVSGAAGLIKSYNTNASPERLGQLLRDNADALPVNPSSSAGRLNIGRAMSIVSAPDNAPVIDSLSLSSNSVSRGGSVTAIISARDADSDPLYFAWEATGGTLSGGGAGVNWTAPGDTPGEFVVKVTVTDGRGGSAVATAAVTAGLDGLLRMEVYPHYAVLNQGGAQKFDAYGIFSDGTRRKVQPNWAVEGRLGIVGADGVFTALSVGSGNVTASLGAKSAAAEVVIGGAQAPAPLTVSGMTNKSVSLDSDGDAIVVGDVTGDGKNDVVVITGNNKTNKVYQSSSSAGNITLSLLGGGFTNTTTGSDGALGDLDADGDLDMVEGDKNGGGIYVYKNNGSGVFSLNSTLSAGSNVYTLQLRDMDNNGTEDIVAGPTGSGQPVVYWNSGTGSFTGPATVGAFSACAVQHTAVGDINNDGLADIVRVCETPGVSIESVLNSGGQAFAGAASAIAGTSGYMSPYGVLSNITSGDDNLDLTIIDGSGNVFRTFTGNGDGTFSALGSFDSMPPGLGATQFDMADASNDGTVDLLSAPNNTAANKLWKNNGSGGFTNAVADQYAAQVGWGALGDLEGDNDTDLIMIAPAGNAVWINDAGNPKNLQAPTNLSGSIAGPNTFHLQWDGTGGVTPVERLTFDIKFYSFNGTATSTVISGAAAEREGRIGHATRSANSFGHTVAMPQLSGSGVVTWAVRAVDGQFFRSNWSANSSISICPAVSSTADSGDGTLRDCVAYANAHPGTTITFSPAIADGTITLLSALPDITAAGTVIDGGSTNIKIDGASCPSCTGFTVTADTVTIKSLTIKNFDTNGIFLLSGSGATIGGATSASRNVITGNGDAPDTEAGINVDDEAFGAVIQNNYIGVSADGITASPNVNGLILGPMGDSQRGTSEDGNIVRDNVISGNTNYGIYDENLNLNSAAGERFYNNIIGLAADGVTPMGNTDGIFTYGGNGSGHNIYIGAAGDGNTISCNTRYGVYAETAETFHVAGNRFGTTVAGTALAACPDPQDTNIFYAASAEGGVIGGDRSLGEGNIIGGASGEGIRFRGIKNGVIQGNYIGTNAAGTADFGNGNYGVMFTGDNTNIASGNKLGDSTARDPNLGNIIAYNDTAGVYADAAGSKKTVQDEIFNNSIYSNGGTANKGILLASGAHNGITTPLIMNAVCKASNTWGPYDITVDAKNSTAIKSTVFLYRADNTAGSPAVTADSAGGEGYAYLADLNTAGAIGTQTVTFTNVTINGGRYISSYRNNIGSGAGTNRWGFSEFSPNYTLPNCIGNTCPLVYDSGDSGENTLRDCMQRAEADGTPTTITFAVSGTITVLSALPALTEGSTTIDGGGAITVDGGGTVADGFTVTSANNTIKNIAVTNFASAGVYINGAAASGNLVDSSQPGTNKYGVAIGGGAANNTVTSNTIAGNTDSGVWITDTGSNGNIARVNMIGAGNGTGVKISGGAQGNFIGGAVAGQGNTIKSNTGAGVDVSGAATDFNLIARNITYSNGGKGIKLDGAGSNNDIQPPAIASVYYDGLDYDITGTAGCASYPCYVDLYLADDSSVGVAADPSGSGEGYEFIASATISAGTAYSFMSQTITNVNGTKITAALRDATGNTSEFSVNYTLPPPNGPPVVSAVAFNPVAINADGADQASATADVSDPQGYAEIATVTINLTAFGLGSSVRMYDDGLHGDGAAGDGKFGTVAFTAPYGTAVATYTVAVTALDIHNATGTANGSLGVIGSTCPIVRSANDSGLNTLRECILYTNTNAGGDSITFSATMGDSVISLASALPAITDNSTGIINNVSGRSIRIDGGGGAFDCLTLQSATNTVSNIVFTRCGGVGSTFAGLHITGAGAHGNTVQSSYFGTDAAGTAGLGDAIGVRISAGAANNTLTGNVISGNSGHGAMIGDANTTGNKIIGSSIGIAPGGGALANGGNGVYISNSARSNQVGGTGAGEANSIANNTGDGINASGANTDFNQLRRNVIYRSGGLGINVSGGGANDDMAAPVISSSLNNGSDYNFGGTVTCPAYPCSVELYKADETSSGVSADASGAGEGTEYLGSAAVASGTAFTFSNITVSNGTKVTATVTSNAGNTSNFAANKSLPPFNYAPVVTTVLFNPASIPGDGQTTTIVTASASDQNGSGDLSSVKIDITGIGGAATVTMYDDGAHNDGGAGDSVYGATFTAAFDQAVATYTLTVTATDAGSKSGTANGQLGITGTSCPSVTNPSDTGLLGTLRDCINKANSGVTTNAITFDPGMAGKTTALTSALPAITKSGTSITNGTAGDVIVNGGGAAIDCFTITTTGVTISGLSIVRCGTAATLTAGIKISGAGATGNTIKGNYIGTNAAGATGLGNSYGIAIVSSATNNTIGGTAAGSRNIISGNVNSGVYLAGGTSGATVAGNYIGVNKAGTAAQANSGNGVWIASPSTSNTIGGTAAGSGNVISGNGVNGILINGQNNNVFGNYIGVNAAGDAKVGNQIGAQMGAAAAGNKIGGANAGEGNIISGNTIAGVDIGGAAANNSVQGNYIGTNAAGVLNLGNPRGVTINTGANLNSVGGAAAGAANLIVNSAAQGVLLDSATTIKNTISRNRIFNNATLGIDLTNNANSIIIAPTITKVINNGGITFTVFATVPGGIPTACSAAKPCTLEIFSADDTAAGVAADATAGEGYQFATAAVINTCNATPCSTTITNITTINANSTKITATVTDGDGNTSKFANNYTIPLANFAPVISNITFTPSSVLSDGSETATLTVTVTDVNGAADINIVYASFTAIAGATTPLTLANSGGGTYTAGGITIPAGSATGAYTISVSAADFQFATGTATGSFTISGSPCPNVKKTGDTGMGTLRDCVGYANLNPGTTVVFDPSIAGSTISPLSALPSITTAGTIINGSGGITISGASCANCHGLVINNVPNCEIKNMTINRFSGAACDAGANKCAGVNIKGAAASGNKIRNTIIGTNAGDSTAVRNNIGVLINGGAHDNTVGGAAADVNVISNNTTTAVSISGAGSDGNIITGNYIGLNNSGNGIVTAAPMQTEGVAVTNGAKNTVIGTAAARNVISGSATEISISGAGSDGTVIQNNYIGTESGGAASLAAAGTGISVAGAANTVIGGDAGAAQGNTIAGAPAAARTAIKINAGTTGTIIRGNNIGVLANGTASGGAPAGSVGIFLTGDTGTTIGGTVAGQRNVVGANSSFGIQMTGSTAPVIKGNYIGTSAAGTASLGNGTGIYLSGGTKNAVIGGTAAGEANTIINNTANGISAAGAGTDLNSWRSNIIYKSGGGANKGILLDGIANQNIAKPVIQYVKVVATDTYDISGTSACAGCAVELYRADDTAGGIATDTAGGEGFKVVSAATADGAGAWSVTGLVATGGTWFTAVVTDTTGNSSEFAANKEAANYAPDVASMTFSPGSLLPGSATLTQIIVTVTDPNGPSDISGAVIDLSPINAGTGATVMMDTGVAGAGVAKDGIFALYASVGANLSPGTKNVTVTAADAHGLTDTLTAGFTILNSTSTVSAPAASPSEVAPGFSTLTLSVTVADLNGIGDVSAVTIDLSPLGGAAAALMYDDGAHGDGAASDGIFALTGFAVTASASYGTQTIKVTSVDVSGAKGTATSSVYVNRPSTLAGLAFNPSSLAADGTANTSVTVTAADPETMADIVSVLFDGSSIGAGAALALVDNGLQNDGAAGDGVYGRLLIYPPRGWPAGTYKPVVTLKDKFGRTVTASATLTIVPGTPMPPTIISTDGASATVKIVWRSPSVDSNDMPLGNLAGHYLFRKIEGGSYSTVPLYIHSTTATDTLFTYNDAAVTAFVTYCYYMVAFDSSQLDSSASAESCVSVYPKAWVYAATFGDQTTGSFLPAGSPGIFNRPMDSAVDGSGNVFVTDYANHRIQKFASDGVFIGARGAYGSGAGNFKNPAGIAYSAATGFIYVTDSHNRIQVFDTTDAMNVQAGLQISVTSPLTVTVSPADGTLYVSTGMGKIKHLTTAGALIGEDSLAGPRGIGIDGAGQVYVSSVTLGKVYRFGAATATIGTAGTGFNNFLSPYGVAFDRTNNLIFIADRDNDRVMVYNAALTLNNLIGGKGSDYGKLRRPTGVVVDAAGNLYVTDNYNNRVQKFLPPPGP